MRSTRGRRVQGVVDDATLWQQVASAVAYCSLACPLTSPLSLPRFPSLFTYLLLPSFVLSFCLLIISFFTPLSSVATGASCQRSRRESSPLSLSVSLLLQLNVAKCEVASLSGSRSGRSFRLASCRNFGNYAKAIIIIKRNVLKAGPSFSSPSPPLPQPLPLWLLLLLATFGSAD